MGRPDCIWKGQTIETKAKAGNSDRSPINQQALLSHPLDRSDIAFSGLPDDAFFLEWPLAPAASSKRRTPPMTFYPE